MKIGVFDSGMGGRYTLEACQKNLPQHQFVGFFDSANAPYGDKSQTEILTLTEIGVLSLFSQGCDLVLIACNTACTQALRRLQEKYPQRKILGCLIPAVETAVDQGHRQIGLIGTNLTVNSKKYQRELFKLNPRAHLVSRATPKLVPWIETGKADSTACLQYLEETVATLIEGNHIECLILGCTHYSVFKSHLKRQFPQLKIVDSSQAQVEKLILYLGRRGQA